ncbi:helix-turn-helix transcriptional regulator [Nocardioides zeae]|uniref:Helix-turn-helix transcriptional regulator n=1 Tax=Nocardioides imazamoxiresistens TaxID=3231893 RepID=A0ABU3Q058_9ACTN|nr:helix-turn-helix transcriptional regulator [Nocardioides zeae]MDT9594826.1 helix-turn-helix transcriptional regulator [Nocardioides zeae]
MPSSDLRDFLRAARSRVAPDPAATAGDAAVRTRRVKGLRREEVARAAGVSVDYYTRLEQGRAGAVSSTVLTGVARALRLNATEQAYFFALAGDLPAVRPDEADAPPQRVRAGVHHLIAGMPDRPAIVHGTGLQVLAMNELARKVFFDAEALPFRERNLARFTFLDPAARERYVDWAEVASTTAAVLRADAGLHPDDRALHELVGELSVRSPEFAALWAEHRVHDCAFGTKRLRHPAVGEFEVGFEAFDVPGSPEHKLKIYTAAPGSPDADALRLIASYSA